MLLYLAIFYGMPFFDKIKIMPNSPRLLDQLVSLTGIRDLELLEVSLLKTLHRFINPVGLSLFKVSSEGEVRSQVVYGADKCMVLRDDFDLKPELALLFKQTYRKGADSVMIDQKDTMLTVMTVIESRAATTYLVISSTAALRRMDTHLINGMLQIYRNFCELLQESQTDSLTGLANRKTFDECFNRVYELHPARAGTQTVPLEQRQPNSEASYWLVMIDIDHFKLVNDKFGHLYGDEVLILLARLLKNALRNDDLVFRFGGEEFVLMIRSQSRDEAAATLERLRQSVASHKVPQVGHITISMGATEMVRNTFSGALLDYADKALYHSKQTGRNKVTFFEDMVAQGLAQREATPDEELDFF